jgi:hypothetical protein
MTEQVNQTVRKRTGFGTSMGVPSIIAILVILVLVVFASLSIVTSKADIRLTEKTVKSVTAYYEADAIATEKMADVADTIDAGAGWTGRLQGEGYQVTQGGTVVTYTVAVDEFRNLNVSLKVNVGGDLSVLDWSLVPTNEWKADDDIHLFQ